MSCSVKALHLKISDHFGTSHLRTRHLLPCAADKSSFVPSPPQGSSQGGIWLCVLPAPRSCASVEPRTESGQFRQVRKTRQHLFHRRQPTRHPAIGESREIVAEPQAQQPIADELAAGQSPALFLGQFPRPAHQFASDHDGVGVMIRGALGEDMPDDHVGGRIGDSPLRRAIATMATPCGLW